MADLEGSILRELRECGSLDAKQLMDKLGRPKKDINRLLYDMEKRKIVEQVDSNGRKGPPIWKLRQDTAVPSTTSQSSAAVTYEQPMLIPADSSPTLPLSGSSTSVGATPEGVPSTLNDELKERVLQVLQESQEPIPALTIARKLGLPGKSDINPILFGLKNDEVVKLIKKTDSKPLWYLIGGPADTSHTSGVSRSSHVSTGGDVAKWDGRLLYTVEGEVGKPITLNPVSKNDVLNRGSQPQTSALDDTITRDDGGPTVPIQESETRDDDSSKDKEKPKINPINAPNSAQIEIPEFDKKPNALAASGQSEMNPSSESEPKVEIMSKGAPVTVATNNGAKKKKKQMAARFPPTASNETTPTDTPTQRCKILELLTNSSMTTEQIAHQLGLSTRAPALQMLEKLECEKKVQRSKIDGINHWSLADDD